MGLRGHQKSVSTLVEMASFLVIRLGRSYLAFPADGVRGVLTQEEAGYEQAVTAAGVVYQAVDLAHLLSLEADLSGSEMRTVLYTSGRSHGAIRVEQVVGLADIERKDCLPLPFQFCSDERNWFGGMMVHQDVLVLIVNPAWALGELAEVVLVDAGEPHRVLAVGGPC